MRFAHEIHVRGQYTGPRTKIACATLRARNVLVRSENRLANEIIALAGRWTSFSSVNLFRLSFPLRPIRSSTVASP